MITILSRYTAMKDTDVEWLGSVPEHWDLRRTKTLLLQRNEKGHPNEPLLAATQTKGVVRKEHYENRTVLAMKDLHLLKFVQVGDFVISLRSFQGGIEYARQRGIISPAYTVLYPARREDHGYLAHLFKSAPYIHNLALFVTGIRQGQNIDYEKLSRSRLPIPPLAEQTAIVRFLDHAERRIRRYILAKERLIELLKEQKQAIIHQAVTGQIDVRTGQPYPAYKDSGVEWLGKVPQHWETRRLKWVTRLQRGYDLPADRRVPGPFPVVSSGGIIDTHFESRCAGPGVVMGRYGSTDAVYYLERDFWPHNTSLFVTNFQGNMKKWCYFLLTNITKADHASKSAVPGLDRKDLFQIIVPVPPLAEQMEAVKVIETASRTMTTAIATTERKIAVIREYRTRLIADVVTGKLDVREAAAGLPDVDRRGTEDDLDDGFDDEAGSEAAVWRHGVDEGSSLVPVSDAGRSEVAEGELMTEGRPSE